LLPVFDLAPFYFCCQCDEFCYLSRSAVAKKRLLLTPAGNVRCQLKTPYRGGIAHVIFEPLAEI